MYVVGVGIRPYKTSWGALSVLLLMSMSETFSVPFYTLIKLCYTRALE